MKFLLVPSLNQFVHPDASDWRYVSDTDTRRLMAPVRGRALTGQGTSGVKVTVQLGL